MSLTKVSFSMITGAPANVLDYGAVGTGLVNDAVALQAAINTGQDVDLAGKTIGLLIGVTVSTVGQKIFNGSIISLNAFSSVGTTQRQFYVTASDVVFENVKFDCNGLAGGSQDFSAFVPNGVSACDGAILGLGAHRLKVDKCYFTRCNVASAAIGMNTPDQNNDVVISNSIFEYNYGGGFFTQSRRNIVSNCIVRKNNNAGIAFNTIGAFDCIVTGSHIEDCQYGGIACESACRSIVISGNTFRQTLYGQNDCSILISSFVVGDPVCVDISITGNSFLNNFPTATNDVGCQAILIQGAHSISITGNVCDNGPGQNKLVFLLPIYNDIKNVSVDGNTISGGLLGALYTNLTTVNVDNVIFSKNNLYFTTGFFYAPAMATMAAQTTGVVFDGNYAPSSTGPVFLGGGGYSSPTWTFTRNYMPAWGNFAGVDLGLLLNTYGIKYADYTGNWKSNAVPTERTWFAGDVTYTNSPAVGQPKGWVCTVLGTPGTWVSQGNL